MTEIACGVPIITRERALRQFLGSVPDYVSTVYVADNGADQDRALYNEDWPFKLDVLHLSYDCGIGHCRHRIVQECAEPYLWMGDCDMAFSRDDDLRLLQDVLEANPDLGGVAGWLIEDNIVRSGARNLRVEAGRAIKTVDEEPEMERGPVPFSRFDFIPQAALFRREVFDDYAYDPAVGNSEHFDFFMAHRQTQWEFASTPAVSIIHDRDINEEYRNSERGGDHVDLEVIEQKWGVSDIVPGDPVDWGYLRDQSIAEQAFGVFRRVAPAKIWIPTKRGLEVVIQ